MNRIEMCATTINREWKNYSILDVGCRDKSLKPLLSGVGKYHGIDLVESDEVTAHDLEKPVPFADERYDIVVALDVIEHVENAHQLMAELVRVAEKAVIVSLPNMYYWRFRIRVLMGKDIGGKYRFSPEPIKDRHRWVPSYKSSEEFVRNNAGGYPVEVIPVVAERKSHKLLTAIDTIGSRFAPNFFAYGGMYVIRKQ